MQQINMQMRVTLWLINLGHKLSRAIMPCNYSGFLYTFNEIETNAPQKFFFIKVKQFDKNKGYVIVDAPLMSRSKQMHLLGY